MHILDDINESIQCFMLMLFATNVPVGLLTWVALRWIGVENAGAWAVAAGLLHLIPYFGPAVTAAAIGMAAFLQFDAPLTALLFWGWLWGVWGMLLSIPIIVIVKVVARHVEQLQPVAQLLGE